MKRSASSVTLVLGLACLAGAFSMPRAQAQTLNYIATFNGTNGQYPSTVIQATDGNLYGTTAGGALGPAEEGNIFKITPAGELSTVYNFCSRNHCLDGRVPYTPPILGNDGNLYGVTSEGGSDQNGGAGWGTVYRLTLGGKLTTLHAFCTDTACLDGTSPAGIMQAADGNFYGVTYEGGQHNGGTLFKMTPGGGFSIVHTFCSQFNCADGQWPISAPIQGTDGNLYGLTSFGGQADAGILYSLTTAGRFNVVHTFLCYGTSCNFGGEPIAILQDVAGNLIGATESGGTYGLGTEFEITTNHQYLNLYTFSQYSPGSFVPVNDGNFYGVSGGINGAGSIFQLAPSGTLTTLYDFAGGSGPNSNLFQAPNGNLYGSTDLFSDQWGGAIYSFSNNLSPLVQTVPTLGKIGKTILILGNSLTDTTSVTFNGVAAKFTVESDTYIKATVPKGATTGTVSVITPSGTLNSNPQFVVTK